MKLNDVILSKLDSDPATAKSKLDALSNSDLIELISDGMFMKHTSAEVLDRYFDEEDHGSY